jgi:hypothetical protein
MRGERLNTLLGVDDVDGERVRYIGPTIENTDYGTLKHGEVGVAWITRGYEYSLKDFDFYPDGDGVGYGVNGAHLELEY